VLLTIKNPPKEPDFSKLAVMFDKYNKFLKYKLIVPEFKPELFEKYDFYRYTEFVDPNNNAPPNPL